MVLAFPVGAALAARVSEPAHLPLFILGPHDVQYVFPVARSEFYRQSQSLQGVASAALARGVRCRSPLDDLAGDNRPLSQVKIADKSASEK